MRRGGEGVLVIGAGGIGCPALLHLASSGVTPIGVADHDVVQRSNLPRQILYREDDIGRSKVDAAASALEKLPGARTVAVHAHAGIMRGDEAWIGAYAVVIEAVDRADSKLLIHDAIVLRGIPLVHAGGSGWEAQGLTVRGPGCLRCLFGSGHELEAPDCVRDGILGPVVGLAGLLAAEEAIRLLASERCAWERRLWSFDARIGRSRYQSFEADAACAVCGTKIPNPKSQIPN